MSSVILFDGMPVTITRRSNAVRLKLTCVPGREGFSLSVPPGCGSDDIRRFLQSQQAWMHSHAEANRRRWEPLLTAGEQALLGGDRVTLGRDGIPCGKAFLQLRAKTLEQAVRRLLPLWEQRMNVHIRRIALKDMSSQWGSCTPGTAHISLSVKLGAMPE